MKPIAAFILCLCLLALCRCGQPEPVPSTAPSSTEETTTTQAPSPPPIAYPASYQDAPEAYKPILDEFYREAQVAYYDNGEEQEAFVVGGEYINEPWFSKAEDLGYAVEDINNDGIPELLLLNRHNVGWGPSEEPFIYALYTLQDDKPVQLGVNYWRRERVHLTADGTIYQVSGNSKSARLISYKLQPGATELTALQDYGGDLGLACYEIKNGNQLPITDEELQTIWDKYDNPPNPMKFDFIPIEQ